MSMAPINNEVWTGTGSSSDGGLATYIVSTAAKDHLFGETAVLSKLRALPTPVEFRRSPGEEPILATHQGDWILNQEGPRRTSPYHPYTMLTVITDVYWAAGFRFNVLSLSRLCAASPDNQDNQSEPDDGGWAIPANNDHNVQAAPNSPRPKFMDRFKHPGCWNAIMDETGTVLIYKRTGFTIKVDHNMAFRLQNRRNTTLLPEPDWDTPLYYTMRKDFARGPRDFARSRDRPQTYGSPQHQLDDHSWPPKEQVDREAALDDIWGAGPNVWEHKMSDLKGRGPDHRTNAPRFNSNQHVPQHFRELKGHWRLSSAPEQGGLGLFPDTKPDDGIGRSIPAAARTWETWETWDVVQPVPPIPKPVAETGETWETWDAAQPVQPMTPQPGPFDGVPHTGAQRPRAIDRSISYYVSTVNPYHVFCDLAVLSDVRPLPSPVRFNKGAVIAHHVGSLCIRCTGKDDIVVPEVYWSKRAHFNALSLNLLLQTGEWRIDFEDPSGMTHEPTETVLPFSTPHLYSFRMPHRGRGTRVPSTNGKNRPLLMIPDSMVIGRSSTNNNAEEHAPTNVDQAGGMPDQVDSPETSNQEDHEADDLSEDLHSRGDSISAPLRTLAPSSDAQSSVALATVIPTTVPVVEPNSDTGSAAASVLMDPPLTTVIDAEAFPLIIDIIFGYASNTTLLKLRGLSRYFQFKADCNLFAHVELNLLGQPHLTSRGGPDSGLGPRFITLTPDTGTAPQNRPNIFRDRNRGAEGVWFPDTVSRMMFELNGLDGTLRANVKTLDLHTSHLDRLTMDTLSALFPSVVNLRLMSNYSCDVMEQVVVVKTIAKTLIVFIQERKSTRELHIPSVPRNIRQAVFHIKYDPRDPDTMMRFNSKHAEYPHSLEHVMFVFWPAFEISTSTPSTTLRHAWRSKQKQNSAPREPCMMTELEVDIVENCPRKEYTLVGFLELSPDHLGLPYAMNSMQKRRFGFLDKLRTLAWHRSSKADDDSNGRRINQILSRINFVTIEEYLNHTPPEQWHLAES